MNETLKNILRLRKQEHRETDTPEKTKKRIQFLSNYIPSWKKKITGEK